VTGFFSRKYNVLLAAILFDLAVDKFRKPRDLLLCALMIIPWGFKRARHKALLSVDIIGHIVVSVSLRLTINDEECHGSRDWKNVMSAETGGFVMVK
jgi:hypothetical protein